MKLIVKCDWCGTEFERYESKIKGKAHHFCSKRCLADYSNKEKNPIAHANLKDYSNMSIHLSALNRQLNSSRMTYEVRAKIRNSSLNKGKGKSYSKYYGVHEHRIVAEKMLGRPLSKEETIHHIDGNKRNNSPSNLLILASQSEHAKLHMRERKLWNGGDAE